MCQCDSDRPVLTDVVITPEMLQAGVEALTDTSDSSSVFQAKSVFRAMIEAMPEREAPIKHLAD